MKKVLLGLSLLFTIHPTQAWDCSWLLNKLQSKPGIIAIASVAACVGAAWWVAKQPDREVDRYCQEIRDGKRAGDQFTMQAMANIYDLNIQIDHCHSQEFYKPQGREVINTIGIVMYHPTNPKPYTSQCPYYKVFDPTLRRTIEILNSSKDITPSIKSALNAQFDCFRIALKEVLRRDSTTIPGVQELRAQVADHIQNNQTMKEQIRLIEAKNL